MRIGIEGSGELHDRVTAELATHRLDATVTEQRGLDGQKILELVLQYGPDTMKFLTALITLWEAWRKAGKRGKIDIRLDDDD